MHWIDWSIVGALVAPFRGRYNGEYFLENAGRGMVRYLGIQGMVECRSWNQHDDLDCWWRSAGCPADVSRFARGQTG